MRRRMTALLLAVLLLLCSCGVQPSGPVEEMTSFTDSCGRTVEIPEVLTRIAPSGAQYQYLPEELMTLPTFGQMYGSKSTINLEALAAAAPQLIIDMGDKREDTGANLDALQTQTGIPAIFIEADLPHMAQAYRTLGSILADKEGKGEAMAAFADRTMDMAEENRAGIPDDQRRTVLYTSGTTGLNTNAEGST